MGETPDSDTACDDRTWQHRRRDLLVHIAGEPGIRANVSGADGVLHEIRGYL